MVGLQRIAPRGWTECIVAATGPSLTESVAERCRDHHVIAVNDAYRRLPFADVLYACDLAWIELHQGCPGFAGDKWTSHDPGVNSKDRLPAAWGFHVVAGAGENTFSLDPGRLHYGGNSGFQAINLAILFGAQRIALVGFDMRTTPARHFFGPHPPQLKNGAKYEHFIPAFNEAARRLATERPDIQIVNCTPGSALTCFPVLALEEVLA